MSARKMSYRERWGHERYRTAKKNQSARKQQKRAEAQQRQTIHNSLSRHEKLQKLLQRPGSSLKEWTKIQSEA